MFATFLSVSGLAFWIILGVIILVNALLLSRHDADDGWPVALAMAGLTGVVFLTDAFVGNRSFPFFVATLGYIAFGAIWSMWKWYGHLVSTRADLRREWEKTSPRQEWSVFVSSRIPTAAYNKQRISNWMMLWPFSFTWWVLTWPRRAFVWLYERLSTVFDRIAARVFAS